MRSPLSWTAVPSRRRARLSVAWALPLLAMLSGGALAAETHGAPPFMGQLTLLLIVAGAAAYVSFRFGLMPIVGFLLAGVLAGPSVLGVIRDPAVISGASEIGVMLLLFAIGIEFSLERLSRIARLIFLGGGLQVGLTVLVAAALLAFTGVSIPNGVFTGFLLALSSTAIVTKVLTARGGAGTRTGQVSLGILIFQDLAVVVMVLLVPMLAGQGGGALGIVVALAKAGGIVAAVLLLARRVVPKLLEVVARTCSQEIFLLTTLAACFATAYLTSLAGVSLALGAFLAGLLVSESRFGRQALGEILPLQILFSAAFFLSVGLQLDVRFMVTQLPLVLGAIVLIALVKALVTTASVRLLGEPLAVATSTGWLIAQVGEFSFVLEGSGRAVGLTPAGLGAVGTQTFIAATGMLMALTPLMARIGEQLGGRKASRAAKPPPAVAPTPDAQEPLAHLHNHVILAGFGPHATQLAHDLHARGVPFGVLTLSPDGAARVAEHDVPVVIGDYARSGLLAEAGIQQARALLVLDDQPEMAARAVSVARALNATLPIIAHTEEPEETGLLLNAGANTVLTSAQAVSRSVLAQLGLDDPGTPRVTLTPEQQEMCEHTHGLTGVQPEVEGVCPECVALGDSWVHLRVCMTCGHVGCCDSSKNRHATQHAHVTRHPVIHSLELGEHWIYCYPDERTL